MGALEEQPREGRLGNRKKKVRSGIIIFDRRPEPIRDYTERVESSTCVWLMPYPWSCATLAMTLQAKHSIEIAAETVHRWLHEMGWVWKRAKLAAKDDDLHRLESPGSRPRRAPLTHRFCVSEYYSIRRELL
jgi:hypothetical protein